MAEQSKKLTLYIFLFALFIALAFFLGTNIYNIYVSTRTTSDDTTRSSLECAFRFTISKVNYDFPSLSFQLYSSEVDTFHTLVIMVEGIETEIPLKDFIDFEQKITLDDIVVEDTFLVYPLGCKDYNSKECSVKTRSCKIVN